MANHKSAIKRIKSDKEKMLRNKYQHKSARTAMLFSRTNTLLSIPMLLTMVAAQNLY